VKVERLIQRLRELPEFLPSVDQVVANLPFLILALWTGFLFFIGFYFFGSIRDLEENAGRDSGGRLRALLGVVAGVTFISMVSLAFYLVWRRL